MKNIPKDLLIIFLVFTFLENCSAIDKAQIVFNETRSGIEENAQVYTEDAFNTLNIARDFNPRNKDIHDRSRAQIVFPKAGTIIFTDVDTHTVIDVCKDYNEPPNGVTYDQPLLGSKEI